MAEGHPPNFYTTPPPMWCSIALASSIADANDDCLTKQGRSYDLAAIINVANY